MKNLLLIAIAILGFSTVSFGQAIGTGGATATIVTPISITNSNSMNFGNVAVQSATGGTAVLTTAGDVTGNLGVTIPAIGGTKAAGSFEVSGVADYTYTIGLSASCLVSDGSNHTMLVNAFNSLPSGTGKIGSGGTQTILVGATLNVDPAQAPGVYTSAKTLGTSYTVTVNYN